MRPHHYLLQQLMIGSHHSHFNVHSYSKSKDVTRKGTMDETLIRSCLHLSPPFASFIGKRAPSFSTCGICAFLVTDLGHFKCHPTKSYDVFSPSPIDTSTSLCCGLHSHNIVLHTSRSRYYHTYDMIRY